MYADLLELGIGGHFAVLTLSERACELTRSRHANLSCFWDSTVLFGLHDLEAIWHMKHRFILRALRLGYNLLYSDSDAIIFDDPYRYVKQPPFSSFQFLNLPENPCGIQASFFYLQVH